jgi:hypothetical protein
MGKPDEICAHLKIPSKILFIGHYYYSVFVSGAAALNPKTPFLAKLHPYYVI